jgi:hypothetical protein
MEMRLALINHLKVLVQASYVGDLDPAVDHPYQSELIRLGKIVAFLDASSFTKTQYVQQEGDS